MNWALLVLQMLSLMEYEERGRVATPEHFVKDRIGVYNCTVAPVYRVEEFNQRLLDYTDRHLSYRRIALEDYPPLIRGQPANNSKWYPEMRFHDGFAAFVGDWRSNSSDIVVECSVDIANFTTVFQVEKIDIEYAYSCEGEEGYLRATISKPFMGIVLLQERNSNIAYTYGYYPPPVTGTNFHLYPVPQNPICRKAYDKLDKHLIVAFVYETTYYGMKEVLDVAGFDLQEIITWIGP